MNEFSYFNLCFFSYFNIKFLDHSVAHTYCTDAIFGKFPTLHQLISVTFLEIFQFRAILSLFWKVSKKVSGISCYKVGNFPKIASVGRPLWIKWSNNFMLKYEKKTQIEVWEFIHLPWKFSNFFDWIFHMNETKFSN